MGAATYFVTHYAACRGDQHPRLSAVTCIRYKAQPIEATDVGPRHLDFACSRNLDWQFSFAGELTHKEGRTLIDKPLGNAIVQRIRESVFDAASTILPCACILDPVASMGDICPSTDVRDACHQSIDVTADAIEIRHLASDPCCREPLLRAGEMDKALAQEAR